MPDRPTPTITLQHRPALSGKEGLEGNGITILPLPEGHVIEVLAKSDNAGLRKDLAALAPSPEPASVRAGAPRQWFIVGDTPLSRDEFRKLADSLRPKADCVDQSHGRVRIQISGPKVEQVLAKGTAVDLALSAFPAGHATPAQIGHVATHLTRIAPDAFEIMVLRGFAESLWDELCLMAREYL
ncbi:sarcosine oxidase subunit gamma family protein [Hoeflea sp.]|uniref:sarcosine oxidase subunit gamma family protein n=1 Tax=Hoeflea sp. TaxID=1940281 RepID=UPI003B52D0B6